MKVVFFHRRPKAGVNFSIESLFRYVRSALPREIRWEVRELRHYSQGLFKRLFIAIEAALNQGDINHITGDVHFIAIFLKKRRTVLTIHDIGFMQHPVLLYRWILKVFWIILPVKRSGLVTTVSEATKQEVLKIVKGDPSRIKVVYDPILPHFQKTPRPFNKTRPTILQIGTKANKNIPRLVEAVKGLNCKLDIIGQLNSELLPIIEQTGLCYSNCANLSDQEVFERYVSADIISFVSTNEGFGMPIVEANAVGRAVLTSNVSSMPEIAGNAAHFVDPFNVESIRAGIIKLTADDNYREQLILNGYENCRRFDVKEIARQYVEVYNALQS